MDTFIRPADWLRDRGAQADVVDALAQFETWSALWAGCPRGDWLLGIAERLGAPHDALVRAAIDCARIVDAGDEGRRVLDVTERWLGRAATADEVGHATRELEEAMRRLGDPASDAAARAVLAVGLAVSDRDVAPAAAGAAAESVILSSLDCGFELALRWAHDRCAAAVRAAIPWEAIAACVASSAGAP